MHIFIDEGGSFVPNTGISIICSLALPSSSIQPIKRKIERISREWPRNHGELKGGHLTIEHLTALTQVLLQYDAILHCCAIDVSTENLDEVSKHKEDQCIGITKYLSDAHSSIIRNQLWELRQRLERMPNQLYLQCVCMSELVFQATQEIALYFSQRRPKELGKFKWFIDAKDPKELSSQEIWWKEMLGPLTESRTRNEPFGVYNGKGFDYSHFEKSFLLQKNLWYPDGTRKIAKGYDIKKLICNNVSFVDSRNEILIQVTDVLASYMRRILSNQITSFKAIECLGKLQIMRKRAGQLQSVQMISLSKQRPVAANENKELAACLKNMTKCARPMAISF